MKRIWILATVVGLMAGVTACGVSHGAPSVAPAVHTNRTYAEELWLMRHEPPSFQQIWRAYGCPPIYYGGSYYFEPPGAPKSDGADAIYLPSLTNADQPWPAWYGNPIPATPHYHGGCLTGGDRLAAHLSRPAVLVGIREQENYLMSWQPTSVVDAWHAAGSPPIYLSAPLNGVKGGVGHVFYFLARVRHIPWSASVVGPGIIEVDLPTMPPTWPGGWAHPVPVHPGTIRLVDNS